MVHIIGIGGGSGAGKSTLANELQDNFPELIEVVYLDDYSKPKEELPVTYGMVNFDHPKTVDFDKLLKDLKSLMSGKDVKTMTWDEKNNPKYEKDKIPHVMKPKQILIVDGYMALTDKRVRDLFDFKIYLDLRPEERMRRRTKFVYPEYTEKILLPIHNRYVEPTKEYADLVVDVNKYQSKEVRALVLGILKRVGLLN